MSINKISKNKEVAVIAALLSIFGVVEERQMRELFGHLPDPAYGKILSRVRLEGLAYRSPDARFIAQSKYAFDRANIDDTVACFGAFVLARDKIQDFCAGAYPALVSIAAADSDYDIIPVSDSTVDAINDALEELPDRTVRYLVTKDLDLTKRILLRRADDYVLYVHDTGEINILKPKGVN